LAQVADAQDVRLHKALRDRRAVVDQSVLASEQPGVEFAQPSPQAGDLARVESISVRQGLRAELVDPRPAEEVEHDARPRLEAHRELLGVPDPEGDAVVAQLACLALDLLAVLGSHGGVAGAEDEALRAP
jgi:hypothetical protein